MDYSITILSSNILSNERHKIIDVPIVSYCFLHSQSPIIDLISIIGTERKMINPVRGT
jgi:hypothetical protein